MCTRVLFIGNSYTAVNDLPAVFVALAHSGRHYVDAGMLAPGGSTLADHVASPDTASTLSSARWNVVVLQEQSQIPSLPYDQQTEMYPAARQLVATIRAAGAQPVFFLGWAHEDGWPEAGFPDFTSMQNAVDGGYLTIGRQLGVPVAPVGAAWAEVAAAGPAVGLWQPDGIHPTGEGSYLAACVFYASIFRADPVGLTYHDGLSSLEALEMQRTAETVVNGSRGEWGL